MAVPHIPNPDEIPMLPQDDGVVFHEPWEAKVFAIIVLLSQRGHFTWPEWVEFFSVEVAAAKAEGRKDHGSAYYEMWLTAAEKLLATKDMLLEDEWDAKLAELSAR